MREFLFDCLRAASIVGPEGRDEHLSMHQWRHMCVVNVFTPELEFRARRDAYSAFIAPTFRENVKWPNGEDVYL